MIHCLLVLFLQVSFPSDASNVVQFLLLLVSHFFVVVLIAVN
ncbi:hypothetical protein HanPI659440_Chr01g0010051 [Helianthus annuus]|nr:hypothetical protein HanPI659440_Chr01g0010051 [Helianthus annuus]